MLQILGVIARLALVFYITGVIIFGLFLVILPPEAVRMSIRSKQQPKWAAVTACAFLFTIGWPITAWTLSRSSNPRHGR